MPDMLAFLAGLRVEPDPIAVGSKRCTISSNVPFVGITVRSGSTRDEPGLRADEAAQAIVTAAHEYARFAEVIEAVKRVRGAYDAMMEKIQPPDERWQKLADEMQALQDIIYYRLPGDAEPKEAADAER